MAFAVHQAFNAEKYDSFLRPILSEKYNLFCSDLSGRSQAGIEFEEYELEHWRLST